MSNEDSDDEYYKAMLSEKTRGGSDGPRRIVVRDIRAISDKDFVVAWQQSDTLEQLAKTLCVNKKSANARANRLREKAVALKKLR